MPGLLKTFKSGNADLDRVQRQVADLVNPIQKIPLLDGVLLLDQVLTTGVENDIAHGLGREPAGYIQVAATGNCSIWDNQSTNPSPRQTLRLYASATTTVSIWVF